MAKVSIPVREMADELGMTVCVAGRGVVEVDSSDFVFPGLQFAGHFVHFANDRVQFAGNAEMTYLSELEPDVFRERMKNYFSFVIPCLVITRGNKVPDIMQEEAKKAGVPLFRTPLTTTRISHRVASFLDRKLAPSVTRHGVLMDIYGVGIMLTGESGIGKSETALELVKRGHQLIADDVVDIRRVSDDRLIGSAPELIRHLMEIRGIGIIDVRHMYGVGAVMLEKTIDIIMEMEDWDETKEYDRLGLGDQYVRLLDVNVTKILMPVRPGRNLAIVVEVAARNFRLKGMGYNAAEEFDRRLRAQMNEFGS